MVCHSTPGAGATGRPALPLLAVLLVAEDAALITSQQDAVYSTPVTWEDNDELNDVPYGLKIFAQA